MQTNYVKILSIFFPFFSGTGDSTQDTELALPDKYLFY